MVKYLLVLFLIAGSMSTEASAKGAACPNCPSSVTANEIFTLGRYTNCRPTYNQEFICVLERGGTYWMKDGATISHKQIDNLNVTYDLPQSAQFIEGSGSLKVYLVDSNATTVDVDSPMARVTRMLNYRSVCTYNINDSVVFGPDVFTNGKASCDELAAQYIASQSKK